MAAFEYKALDANGNSLKGVLEAETDRSARQQLRDQSLIPIDVKAISQTSLRKSGKPSWMLGMVRISLTDLSVLLRQLATMTNAGLPLDTTLATVAKQQKRKGPRRVLLGLRSKVLEGYSLASGMADYPNVFPELYSATVAAAEQAGALGPVLTRLADYTESRQQLTQRAQTALIYPLLLTLVSILVVVGLLTYVVPQVVRVFESTEQELPQLTQWLIISSDFVRMQYHWILLALLSAYLVFDWSYRTKAFRYAVHHFLLTMPISGYLIRTVNAARFSRTLGILFGSGVPMLQAVSISSEVITSLPIRDAVKKAGEEIREGSSISPAVERTGYFTPMTVQMIASGESSGNLQEMLERSAASQERELESALSLFLGLFEPLMILIMGGVVLTIVIAILLPILDLNQLVG